MKFTVVLTSLFASTMAVNVLQTDGSIKFYADADLVSRQNVPTCCSTGWQAPCLCGTGCAQCNVSVMLTRDTTKRQQQI